MIADNVVEFSNPSVAFAVTAFYEKEFQEYRHRCGISESDYIASLARCSLEKTTGGKSGASFYRTKDRKYFLKESLTNWTGGERESFLAFVPLLLEHLQIDSPTIITKIFGFCTFPPSLTSIVSLTQGLVDTLKTKKNGTSVKRDFVVLENLFAHFREPPSRIQGGRSLNYACSHHVAIRSERNHFSIRKRTDRHEIGWRLDQRRFSNSHLLALESSNQVCSSEGCGVPQRSWIAGLFDSRRRRWSVDSLIHRSSLLMN